MPRSSLRMPMVAMFTAVIALASTAARATAFSTPVIQQVVPATLSASTVPQNLTINGQQFQRGLQFDVTTPGGATLNFRGTAIQAQSETTFQVAVPLADNGRYSMVVTNPDGGVSAPFIVEIQSRGKAPAPVIQRVLPDALRHDQAEQTLRVEGQGFVAGLRLRMTSPIGEAVPDAVASHVTATSLDVTVRLDMAGTYEIALINPSGAVSNVVQLDVK